MIWGHLFSEREGEGRILTDNLYPMMKHFYPHRSALFQDDEALFNGKKGSLNGVCMKMIEIICYVTLQACVHRMSSKEICIGGSQLLRLIAEAAVS